MKALKKKNWHGVTVSQGPIGSGNRLSFKRLDELIKSRKGILKNIENKILNFFAYTRILTCNFQENSLFKWPEYT